MSLRRSISRVNNKSIIFIKDSSFDHSTIYLKNMNLWNEELFMQRPFSSLILISTVIYLGLFFSGCATENNSQNQADLQPTIEATQDLNEEPIEGNTIDSIEQEMIGEQEALIDNVTKNNPRTGFSVTDPNTVNLSTGGILLVEFFAFW
jgi:hypothetical protein